MAKASKKKTQKSNHPWLMAAVLCDSVLQDKDGVFSAIRIIDRISIALPPEWDDTKAIVMQFNGLLGFKAGDVTGERRLRLYFVSPDGKREKLHERMMPFTGGGTGINVKLNLALRFQKEGVYWIEVFVEKWLATRMPITIEFKKSQSDQKQPSKRKDAKQLPREKAE